MTEFRLQALELVNSEGQLVRAIQYRHEHIIETPRGRRLMIGATRWAIDSGETIRPLGVGSFEVVETGEVLQRR